MSGDDVIQKIVDALKPCTHKKMAIGVLATGNGSNLQALIDFSKSTTCAYAIHAVITNNPQSRAPARAEQEGIANYVVDHREFSCKQDFESQLIMHLQEHQVELVVLAGFLRILTTHFLSHFVDRIVNLHPSLLPNHKGLHAIENALRAGDREAGCSVHLVDAGLDTGPMIAQSSCRIYRTDDLEALRERIQKLEHKLLPLVVNRIATRALEGTFT